jgi:thiol-disulfide isomerase/thioredoxin
MRPARMLILAMRALTVLLFVAVAVLGVAVYRLAADARVSALPASGGTADATYGKFSLLASPRPAPAVMFATRAGAPASFADFAGRVVLVNLWATWCAPCVEEMPSLARLQAKLGDLAVLAVSEDRRGAELVDPFVAKLGLDGLAIYLDPKNDLSHAFAVDGLPTSFLIDRSGRVVGTLVGAAAWDSPAMIGLLRTYLAAPQQAKSD